jgi:tetratricopeptide (TPR) repeat protein
MRLAISQDPYSLENALTFAQYAEQLQLYHVATGAYKYCADLFEYLYENEPLPESIYLPWIMSTFNTEHDRYKCLDIVRKLRAKNQFDMLAEVIAAKVLTKLQQDDSEKTLRDTETRLLADWQNPSVNVPAEQMAWFYAFALKDIDKALDYANKAYSQDVNSIAASSILAYLLAENDQVELAESVIKSSEKNQIAEITQAKIFLKQNKKEEAITLLKESVEKNPNTLESSLAKEILVANNSEYVTPIDTEALFKGDIYKAFAARRGNPDIFRKT